MPDKNIILVFHQTSERFFPGINNLPSDFFFALLDTLAKWGFRFDCPSETDADHPYLATITFDDGYEDNLGVLSALCDRGVRPILFIPTDFIGVVNSWEYSARLFPARHLTAGQIRRLSDSGVVIGSHGASHRSFTALPSQRRTAELDRSRKTLEDITGKPVDSISFPFGRFNDTVIAETRACGYARGFGLNRIDRPSEGGPSFINRRQAVYGNDDYYSLYRRLVKSSRWASVKSDIVWRLAGGTSIVSHRLK
jgi:hypothetical protein